MRAIKSLAVLAAFTLLFSIGAFAKNHSNSGSFDLTQQAQIGQTVLQPGHYTAEWNGPESNVNVTILQHGKTVATTHAKLKELPTKSPYSAVTLRPTANQEQTVDEIDFNNRTEALVIQTL